MRARLLVIVLVVVGLVAAGLGGLLAWTTAQVAQEGFFTRRLTDTVHLASLVQRPLTDAAGADLDALCEKLLANPLIEDYEIVRGDPGVG